MRIFNLAEELEKERQKNEELKSKLKATNKVLNDMDNIAGEYEERIDKAIKYINEMCLCSDGYFDYGDDLSPEYLVNILKGSDNNE